MPKQQRYLFFDTELSGCDQIVSIGYIMTDTEGNTLEEDYYIVKPYRNISKTTIAIHGITTQQAKAEGITLRRAMARFINAMKACTVLIGYAPQNDILALSIGCKHLKRDVVFDRGESIIVDVARMAAHYMVARGEINQGQTPSLEHIHATLTDGAEFDMHNALGDAKATARCFFALQREGCLQFDAILPYCKVLALCGTGHAKKSTSKAKTEASVPDPHAEATDSETVTDTEATPTTAPVPDSTPETTSDTNASSAPAKKKKKKTLRRRKKSSKKTSKNQPSEPTE